MEKQSVDFQFVEALALVNLSDMNDSLLNMGLNVSEANSSSRALSLDYRSLHHFGHYVWRRGPRKPRGDRGALHLQKGAEGDHLLHSGVWDGYHGLAGHLFHQSGGHRHIHRRQVARRSAPMPFLLLLHAVLRIGWHVYSVRNVSGEISGHKPRVLLLAACGPGYGSVRADGDVPGHIVLCILPSLVSESTRNTFPERGASWTGAPWTQSAPRTRFCTEVSCCC